MAPQVRLILAIGLILALPFGLIAGGIAWPYSILGQIDAYFFVGYFKHFDQIKQQFPADYRGSRLPWILLGVPMYAVFGPIVGNLALKFAVFYASAFLFLVLARLYVPLWAATLGAILMMTDGLGLRFVGSDYVSAIVNVYGLAAAYLVVLFWRRDRSPFFAFLAGVFTAWMVFSHFLAVALVAALAVLALIEGTARGATFRQYVELALAGSAGAVTATVVLGLTHLAIGYEFWFLGAQIDSSLRLAGVLADWQNRGGHWLTRAWWLTPALLIGAMSLAYVALPWRGWRATIAAAPFSLLAIWLVGSFIAFHWLGLYYLERQFYTVFGIWVLYLAICEQLSAAVHEQRLANQIASALIAAAVVAAVWDTGWFRARVNLTPIGWPLSVGLTACGAVALVLWRMMPRTVGIWPLFIVVLLARPSIELYEAPPEVRLRQGSETR